MDQMIGKVIDSYKILEVLGRGGMGVVYRATDTTLDRDVALKMMDALIASDPNFLKRFQSEAKALAKLQNPNIVSIFALRETPFGVCIVMEFVKGKTLAEVLKQSVLLPIPRVTHIFKQLLTALDHAHKGGVIHRDIKPGNVMLAEGDVVKVTDFGLAKIQKGAVSTMTMGTAGTLYYMSPEQIRGLGQVDLRGDIYSAGMAMYESLAGRVPFKNDDSDFAIAQMIVEGRIPPPDKINAALPKELVKIVMKSIDKDPAKRYQTAAEMVHAIERFESTMKVGEHKLSDAPTIVAAHGTPLAPPKKVEPKPTNVKLYAGIGIAALVLVVTFFLLRPSIFPEEGRLSVQTTPVGGKVYIDNNIVQANPVSDVPIAPGVRTVTVKWGATRTDTSVTIAAGQSLTLKLAMKKTPETVSGSPRERIVSPPLTPTGSQAEGEKTHEATPPHVSDATITLEAVPGGEVKIDDGPFVSADEKITRVVKPGTRTVTFRNAAGATRQRTLELKPGETNGLKCYFNHTVSVTSTTTDGKRVSAMVILDGKKLEDKWTNTELTLAAGRHRIGVQLHDFEVVSGEQTLTIEPSFDGTIRYNAAFKLRKK